MKKSNLILSIIAATATVLSAVSCNTTTGSSAQAAAASDSTAVAQLPAGSIVFFNLDAVIEGYEMANELRAQLEGKNATISAEINRRQKKLEKDFNDFNEKLGKQLFTQAAAEEKAQKLQEQKTAFENYVMQKNQEMQEEQIVVLNQISDAINTFVKEYNEEKQFAMILSTQGDLLPAPVVTADESLDITEEIIAGLNAEYAANKDKKDE